MNTSIALRAHGRVLATAAMIGSAACWGSATVMSRDLLQHFQAPTLLVIQLAASVAVLLLAALPHRPLRYASASLAKISLTGILEPGLTYSFALWGLSLTSAGRASVIGSMEPVFIIVLAWLLFGRVPTRRLVNCVLVAMAGLVLVSFDGTATDGGKSLVGDLLVVLGTLFAAAYVVISSRVADQYPTAVLVGSQQLVGLVCAVIIYLAGRMIGFVDDQSPDVSWNLVLYAALSGVVQYAMAFWLYLTGLRLLSAGAAGLWLSLIPVFGIGGAYLWLDEVPTLPMLVGTVLVIAAVYRGRQEA